MDLLESNLSIDPNNHWYYKEKFYHIHKAIKNYFPDFSVICDVGAGSAPFLKEFAKIYPNKKYYASDINYSEELIDNKNDTIIWCKDVQKANVFFLTDVLEHLSSPKEILLEIKKVCSKDSLIIVTVPAHKALWSGHDIFLKHHRRYSKEELKTDLAYLNGELLEICYIYNLLFFPAFLSRLFYKQNRSQMQNYSRFTNFMIFCLLKIDRFFKNALPFGISLFAVIRIS